MRVFRFQKPEPALRLFFDLCARAGQSSGMQNCVAPCVASRMPVIPATVYRGKKHSRTRHEQWFMTSSAKTETTFIHTRPVHQQRFATDSVISSDKIPGFPDRD